VSGQQLILRDHQLRQREQAEQLRSVLGQLFCSGQFDDETGSSRHERMLNPRADPCHYAFECGHQLLRQAVLHRFDPLIIQRLAATCHLTAMPFISSRLSTPREPASTNASSS